MNPRSSRRSGTLPSILAVALALALLLVTLWQLPSPAHAEEAEAADDAVATGLDWGFKSSLIQYVGESGVSVTGDATRTADGGFHFPVEEVAYDAETGSTEAQFSGGFQLLKYPIDSGEHLLELRLSSPRLVITADAQVLYARAETRAMVSSTEGPAAPLVDYGEIPVATLDLSRAQQGTENGLTDWSGIETFATQETEEAYTYAAGTRLDDLAFSYEGEGGMPDLGDPEWSTPGSPKYAVSVSSEKTGTGGQFAAARYTAADELVYAQAIDGKISAFDSETMTQLGTAPTDDLPGDYLSGPLAIDENAGRVFVATRGTSGTAEGSGEDGGIYAYHWDRTAAAWKTETVATPAELAALSTGATAETREGLAWMVYDSERDRLVALLVGSQLQQPDVEKRFRIVTWEPGSDGSWSETASYPAVQPALPDDWSNGGSDYSQWWGATANQRLSYYGIATDGSIYVYRNQVDVIVDGQPAKQKAAQLRITLGDDGTVTTREFDADTLGFSQLMVEDSAGTLWASRKSGQDPRLMVALPVGDDPVRETEISYAMFPGFGWNYDAERDIQVYSSDTSNAVEIAYQGAVVDHVDFEFAPMVIGSAPAGGSYVAWRTKEESGWANRVSRIDLVGSSPVIETQPVDGVAVAGADGSAEVPFSVTASGDPEVSYQWQVMAPGESRFSDVAGATAASVRIPLTAGQNGASVRVIVSNAAGQLASQAVSAEVQTLPEFVLQPASQKAEQGDQAVFTAFAHGTPDPEISWERLVDDAWTPVSGAEFVADGGQLTVTAAVELDGAQFRAVATSAAGTSPSEVATLSVVGVREIPAEGLTLTGVAFEWDGNAELQGRSPAGAANHFSAGVSDGSEASYLAVSGNAEVLQEIAGERTEPSYATREAFIDAGRQLVRLSNGTAVLQQDGSATISWDAAWSVNMYGGAVPFTISNPVLTVGADGTGELVGDLAGYEGNMADPADKRALPPVADVTIATFSKAALDTLNLNAVASDYAGVQVEIPAESGAKPQDRSAEGWGAWPQEFVDFHLDTGLSSYWYSSGGASDAKKAANPVVVDFTDAQEPPASTAPVVTKHPESQTVQDGAEATFSAGASGDPEPTVQWQQRVVRYDDTVSVYENEDDGWQDIAGASGTDYTVVGSRPLLRVEYRAVFTNDAGSAATRPAELTVTAIGAADGGSDGAADGGTADADGGTANGSADGVTSGTSGTSSAEGITADDGTGRLSSTGGSEFAGLGLSALVIAALGGAITIAARRRERARAE